MKALRRSAIALAAWLPLFVVWVLSAMSFGRASLSSVFIGSLITLGTAGLLGIGVWKVSGRFPWPFGFDLRFYILQLTFALVYAVLCTSIVTAVESLRLGNEFLGRASWSGLVRQMPLGIWFYAVAAGISYAIRTRVRLREKEILASRAEALVAAARLDAIRARLNPHFLFNALHTLGALVKFRPALAESAVERLGDMLRYTLKEDGRELVDFSEEYNFTRHYIAFEQLRYDDRLRVDLQVDTDAYNFEVPPFSIQTLAENAVRHAISVRPQGGSIWIKCQVREGWLHVSVRDDGPGTMVEDGQSHYFGLRSLRERLQALHGSAVLRTNSGPDGFEASFAVPAELPVRPSEGMEEETHEWIDSDS